MSRNTIHAVAGADLSSSQYKWVYADGADTEKIKVAGDAGNATVVGLLEDTPADDAVGKVTINGFGIGIAAEALEPFDYVTSDANGDCRVVDTSNDYILGQYVPEAIGGALPDAADGDEVRILVFDNKRLLHP